MFEDSIFSDRDSKFKNPKRKYAAKQAHKKYRGSYKIGQNRRKDSRTIGENNMNNKKLIEEMEYCSLSFNEAISDIYKYYPKIKSNMIHKLIELDPTFKKNLDRLGDYGKWILNIYNLSLKQNKPIKEEDFYKITDNLEKFIENKKNLKNKDIFQYKSIQDLYSAMSDLPDVIKSNRQKEREFKKEGEKESKKDFKLESDNFYVYIPSSYESSCKLGAGTDWCTATGKNREHYDKYSKDDDLIILIDKKDPKEKYQLHFKSKSFMDKNDDKIKDFDKISKDKKLVNFLLDNLKSKIGILLIGVNAKDVRFTSKDLKVDSGLNLRNTNITSLPDNLKVNGSLYLNHTKITSLPDNLKVNGNLDLENTNITSLPDNLQVGGSLDLENTKITSLPDNLKVNGSITGFKGKK